MNGGNNKNRISELLREIFEDKVLLVTVSILGISIIVFILTISTTNPILKKLNILSIGLTPACLIGLLWDLLIKKKFLNYVKSVIKELFDDAIGNFKQKVCEKCRLVHPLNRFAIKDITANRQSLEKGFEKYLKDAQHRVWILITHFKSLTELTAKMKLLQEWSEKVEIKILGLNPSSESAKSRSKQPDQNGLINDIESSVNKIVKAFKNEGNKERKYVEIKLRDNYPTCCFFLVDSRIFFSPLVFHKRGKDSIHFVVHEKNDEGETSELFKQYEKHFEELFKVAKDTVLEIKNGEVIPQQLEISEE